MTDDANLQPVSLWRNRDYVLLWFGEILSSLGTSCTQFAFPLLIVGLTHSIAAAGLAYSLGQLPYVLLSLPAGALADRWPRKLVMTICTAFLMLCVAAVPLALLLTSGLTRLVILYSVNFGLGATSLFYGLARFAALYWIVPKSQQTTATAQNELIVGSSALLGPALGSLLFSVTRLLPFIADAVSSLILLCSLLAMRTPMQGDRDVERHHLLLEVWEGLTWSWTEKVVRSILAISSYINLVITASTLIVLDIAQLHHIPTVVYGIIIAAGGVGNLMGAVVCPLLQQRINFGPALGFALLAFVILWPLLGVSTTPLVLGGVFAAIAFSDSIRAVLMDSYRFGVVPDALQGRVQSIYTVILFSVLTVGSTALGLSLEHLGVMATVAILWCGLLPLTGFVFLNRHMRQATLP